MTPKKKIPYNSAFQSPKVSYVVRCDYNEWPLTIVCSPQVRFDCNFTCILVNFYHSLLLLFITIFFDISLQFVSSYYLKIWPKTTNKILEPNMINNCKRVLMQNNHSCKVPPWSLLILFIKNTRAWDPFTSFPIVLFDKTCFLISIPSLEGLASLGALGQLFPMCSFKWVILDILAPAISLPR